MGTVIPLFLSTYYISIIGFMAEIIDRSKISALTDVLREQGKTIVTMNGSFDLLHIGHVRCLREAREQGDVLIIALNSDASIQSYKGKGRPFVPQKERAEMLVSLSSVNYVVLFDDINPKSIIAEIRPDIHCNGADWGPGCIEKDVVERGGGRLHILKWSPGRSTTELLGRIRQATASPGAIFLPVPLLSEEKAGKSLAKAASLGLKLVLFSEETASHPEGEEVSPDAAYYGRPFDQALLEEARDELGLALSSSWVVSSDMRHVLAGREVNARTILVGRPPEGSVLPHYEVKGLEEALSIILKQQGS